MSVPCDWDWWPTRNVIWPLSRDRLRWIEGGRTIVVMAGVGSWSEGGVEALWCHWCVVVETHVIIKCYLDDLHAETAKSYIACSHRRHGQDKTKPSCLVRVGNILCIIVTMLQLLSLLATRHVVTTFSYVYYNLISRPTYMSVDLGFTAILLSFFLSSCLFSSATLRARWTELNQNRPHVRK